MHPSIATLALLFLALSAPASAQGKIQPKDAARELAELYADDQRDQTEWERSPERGDEFSKRQHVRRARVIEILESTELEDFAAWDHAAGLLLHSGTVGDFLLSHVLSVPAGAEGTDFGRFTSAAALDRYLATTGREQVFGTQFTVARPDMVEYDVYPAHFMPEHLRQLFRAGPQLRVKNDQMSKRERPPKTSELKKLSRSLDKAKDESVSPEQLALVRSVVYGNEKLTADDLEAAVRILIEALALAASSLDTWLSAVGEAPLFSQATEGEKAPDPPLPAFVRRTYVGK